MYHVDERPLKFSECHGCNVIVKSRRTLAQATYCKAHGQFITKGDLRQDQRSDLIFDGKGVVKFSAFPRRSQAVDWVRSKQPLPGGCRRVKFNGIIHYTISVPNPGRCVLVESVRKSGREMFTFEAGPTTTLAFDIEFGDMLVHIDSSLTFDSFCHSPHIKLGKAHSRCTASLLHYNPSSLCCLEDAPLIPGAIFRLEVQNSSHRTDSGSYIRVCVARQLPPYQNNEQTLSCGSPTHPYLTGRRRLIAHNLCAEFIVQILPYGLIMSRPNSPNIETIHFPLDQLCDQTLWFEIHKVSLRVWQVRERGIVDLDHSYLTFEQDLDDPPPSEPAPPPPRLSLRKPAPPPLPPRLPLRKPRPCQRGSDPQPSRAHEKPHRASGLAGVRNDGYMSDSYVACATNYSTSDRNRGGYVSTDISRSSTCHNSNTCHEFTSLSVSQNSSNTMRRDLLSDNYIDSRPIPSNGANLMALSSLESLILDNDNCSSNNHTLKRARNDPLYEQPCHILEMSKASTRTRSLHDEDSSGKTGMSPARNNIRNPWLPSNGTEECHYNTNKSDPAYHNQSSHNHADNSADNGFVKVIPQDKGRRTTSMANRHLSDLDRNLMCELWVEQVNDNQRQRIWSFQEDSDLIRSQDCQPCQEYHGEHCCGPANAISQREINRRPGDSDSSIWLSGLDYETIQHNLEIHIVPPSGKLKCHSYYGDSIHSLDGSRKSFTESTKTLTNLHPDFTETTSGFADTRKDNHKQIKRQLSASSVLSSKDMNSNRQETTLKKTFCSTDTLCGSDSTFVSPETHSQSVASDGFDVVDGDTHSVSRDSSDPSDEITHLKRLAQLENMTTPTLNLSRTLPKSHRNKQQQTYNESNYNDADEKSNEGVTKTYQESLTIVNNLDIEKERNEQAIETKIEAICRPNHLRSSRSNIVGSIISNTGIVSLSIGPTIRLPGGVQPLKISECTADQRKNPVSTSTLLFSNVSNNDTNSNSSETTLKKTFCCSMESLGGNDSTVGNHETRPKSVNSDGFNVAEENNMSEECIDSPDEITHLKHQANLDNFGITPDERHLQELESANTIRNKILTPQPCPQQPFSQYCLAGRLSPVPITRQVPGLPRSPRDLGRNHAPETHSVYRKPYEKTSAGDAESSQEALAVINNRDNELNERTVDTNSASICMRNHPRSNRRNIIESIISNSAASCSSNEPITQLPNGIHPKERSETLKRNLDCSPLNKSCK